MTESNVDAAQFQTETGTLRLLTDRLLLRPFHTDDLGHVQRYAVRPEFYKYLPISEQTPESVAAFVLSRLTEGAEEPRAEFTFAVEPHDIGHIIGAVRLQVHDRQHRQGDLGFSLDSDYQGQGYATEAVRHVVRFGFDQLRLHRLWATAAVDNRRSWTLMERVGMVREGLLRDDKLVRGVWRSSYLYAILACDSQA